MATAQMRRVKQKSGTWSTMFPVEQVTEIQSALFVKKLLAVAVSNIMYLRTVFPEHAFGDRCLEDLNLKILRDDSACPGASQVIQWVKGCFDALDKKYLRMIVMALYKDSENPNTIVESYTFKFSYNGEAISIYRNNEKISGANSANETRKATIKLLRTIVVLTQTMKPLPDDVMMTMKLSYYDDVTPNDYEPPGFQPTGDEEFLFKEDAVDIKVGDVQTLIGISPKSTGQQFHEVKLRVKTESEQFVFSNKDSINSVIEDESMELDNDQEVKTVDEPVELLQETPATINGDKMNDCQQITNSDSQEDDYPIVRCPCGYNEDEGMMVLCGFCDEWQHGACFGMTDEYCVPELHVCEACAAKPSTSHRCTDPDLSRMESVTLQSHCLWRRALVAVINMNKLLPHTLAKKMNIDVTVAQGLVNRLEKEGYIKPPPKGRGRSHYKSVQKDAIKEKALVKYFLLNADTIIAEEPQRDNEENIYSGIDCITQKASSMKIEAKPLQNWNELEETESMLNLPSLTKRARTTYTDQLQKLEFELADSQEVEDCNKRRKKRKTSISAQSIVV